MGQMMPDHPPESKIDHLFAWTVGVVVVISATAFAILFSVDVVTDISTCAECRALRVRKRIGEMRWSDAVLATSCSEWIEAHDGQSHAHLWVRYPDKWHRDIFGQERLRTYSSCGSALWGIPADEQLALYQAKERSGSLSEMRAAFRSLYQDVARCDEDAAGARAAEILNMNGEAKD